MESNLVRREAQISAGFIRVFPITVANPFDPEFRAQPPCRQLSRSGRKLRINHQAQLVFPASSSAKRIELMLSKYMSSKTIGVCICPPLRIRQEVNLPVRLLERLAHFVARKPFPPAHYLLKRPADRMPHLDLG